MSSPNELFENAWARCDMLSSIYSYMASRTSGVLQCDEILRAEWVARVAALDLYIHELIAQRLMDVFEGRLPPTSTYEKFMLSNETVSRIRHAPSPEAASAAFDLEVRRQLEFVTYQRPESIADGIRLFSSIELWNEIAIRLGASNQNKQQKAKALKGQLSLIVERRNKIVHEGDMQPSTPRSPWPIAFDDLVTVREFLSDLTKAINDLT